MVAKRNLSKAKSGKKDEFYTQLSDIENELRYYKQFFKDKVVFCNCDDPYESNFFKYFALNFNALGLKKLIVTGYTTSPIIGKELNVWSGEETDITERSPYVAYINEVKDLNNDGRIDLEDVKILLKQKRNCRRKLYGDDKYPAGDFRSEESIKLLQQADVVVTNPPFSLFREYLSQLVLSGKKFLIIGNVNTLTYNDVFPLIKDNKLWIGPSIHSGDRKFYVPDSYPLEAAGCGTDKDGRRFIRVKGVRWFTNIDYKQRHEDLILYKKYNPEEYPKYDNYDAIDVSDVKNIPCDYDGVMGVPITFLDKYNPDQFDLLGYTSNSSIGEDNPLRLHGNSYYDGYVWKCGKFKEKTHRLSSWMPLLTSSSFGGTKCTKDGFPDLYQIYYRVLIRKKKKDL